MPDSLLSLPVELLRAVVLPAIPPVEAVSAYKERQDTLRSLCKTCKALCAVSQPLLWQIFRPQKDDPLPLLIAKQHLAQRVQIFDARAEASYRPLLSRLDCMPGLEDFRLSGRGLLFRKQDWTSLGSAGIKHLTLLDVALTRSDLTSISFPNLVTLTIRASFDYPNETLPASQLPKLQAAYSSATSNISGSWYSTILTFEACPTLEMLQVRCDYAMWPSRFTPPSPLIPLLLAFPLNQAKQLGTANLRCFKHFQLEAAWRDSRQYQRGHVLTTAEHVDDLETLIKFIQSASQILSFSLPYEFHPGTPLPPGRHLRRQKLLDALESRSIKLIWRLNSKQKEDDVAVSREFWQYSKELKARKSADSNDVGEQ
ncbi:hypothetical protein JCM8097_001367 [Rhodosporidiobolus ruineniae]